MASSTSYAAAADPDRDEVITTDDGVRVMHVTEDVVDDGTRTHENLVSVVPPETAMDVTVVADAIVAAVEHLISASGPPLTVPLVVATTQLVGAEGTLFPGLELSHPDPRVLMAVETVQGGSYHILGLQLTFERSSAVRARMAMVMGTQPLLERPRRHPLRMVLLTGLGAPTVAKYSVVAARVQEDTGRTAAIIYAGTRRAQVDGSRVEYGYNGDYFIGLEVPPGEPIQLSSPVLELQFDEGPFRLSVAAGEYIVLGVNGDFNRCCRRTHGHGPGCMHNRAARPRPPQVDIPPPLRVHIAAFTDRLMNDCVAEVRAGRSVPGARHAKPLLQRCHLFVSRGCVPGQGCWDVAPPQDDGAGGPMRARGNERRFRCNRFPCCALPGPRAAELAAQFDALPEVVAWRQGLGGQ